MTCPDLPAGSCKIGGTAWPPALYRRDQLSRDYGTLHPFALVDQVKVDDWEAVEAAVHRKLWRRRVFREVFHVTPGEASAAIRAVAYAQPSRLAIWLRRAGWPSPSRLPARHYRRRRYQGTNWTPALLVLSIALAGVLIWHPLVPAWAPPSVARTVYLLERLH